ncbi:hypothetical protein RCG17_02595 [Neobacillus sp. PS3-12]|uniref:hypothetical protein n=1 Tax=Neobacillus sp. PS3-12 TaxID=3070677 RepID=UPI0027DF7200|nr:hypothetical protein [Neobacillus sp. PS3-12]WML53588.1 hypothetical protein RCG17_02595 [Neobacillus sp. PS3-12]
MKEFVVCYTLENEIRREKIIKEMDVKKEEVVQEILDKVANQSYYFAKGEQGVYWIDSSSIRYIRVMDEQPLSKYQYN